MATIKKATLANGKVRVEYESGATRMYDAQKVPGTVMAWMDEDRKRKGKKTAAEMIADLQEQPVEAEAVADLPEQPVEEAAEAVLEDLTMNPQYKDAPISTKASQDTQEDEQDTQEDEQKTQEAEESPYRSTEVAIEQVLEDTQTECTTEEENTQEKPTQEKSTQAREAENDSPVVSQEDAPAIDWKAASVAALAAVAAFAVAASKRGGLVLAAVALLVIECLSSALPILGKGVALFGYWAFGVLTDDLPWWIIRKAIPATVRAYRQAAAMAAVMLFMARVALA